MYCTANCLELKNVSFSYGDKEVLHSVSMSLKKGGQYAIVGPSGSAGVSLALLKSSYSGNSEWFHAVMRKQYVSILQELEDDTSFCVGLFNGAAGIAMAAHEVLSHEACHKILLISELRILIV